MAFLKEKDICEIFDCMKDDFLNVDLRDVCYHLDRHGEDEIRDEIQDDLTGKFPVEEGLISGDPQVYVTITPERSNGSRGQISIDISGLVDFIDFSMVEDEYDGDVNAYCDDLERDLKEVLRKHVHNCLENCKRYFRRGNEFESFEIIQSYVKGGINPDVEDAAGFQMYIEIEYEML